MPEQPIFEYLMDNLIDGALPQGFSLGSYDGDDSQIHFADGALDGIALYHMARPELPADVQDRIGKGISQASADDYEAANRTFAELCGENRAIQIIDELQRYVLENSASIDAQALWAYTTFLLYLSDNKELVKVGLSFLELFGDTDERVKQVVRTLGLSDEFTLFAAWCARGWENSNQELFQLAKKTKGWGRIHVVEMLDPQTDEIRKWLLHEGVNNNVMPEYSALTCYEKAGVSNLLAGEMSHADFSAATAIVHAALDDAPVMGFSALDNPKAELERYVTQAGKQQLDLADRECLQAIIDYADERSWGDLSAQCGTLLEA